MIVEAMPYIVGSLSVLSFGLGYGWHNAERRAEFWRDQCVATDAFLSESETRLLTANTLVANLTEERSTLRDRVETLSAKLAPFKVKRPRDDKGHFISLKPKAATVLEAAE